MKQFILFILFIMIPALSNASLETCVRACLDAESPVIPPVTPPVTPPSSSKVFPGNISFEEQSDIAVGQYAGKAVVLLPASWLGKILSVGLNGETGYKDTPYKGMPVFRFIKPGNQYSRPLKFTITATDGTVYIATSSTPSPTTPSGKNSESIKPSSCGNPDGANCRQNMRAAHPGSYYGLTPTVNCDGDKYYIKNSSKRQEESGGWIWKPVSDSNKNLVIVGKHGKKYQQCTVIW